MPPDHDPPESYGFNKLRTTGGSYRVTFVKAAVDRADIDARSPGPTFAHLPAAPGAWLAIDVDVHESQWKRVAARTAVTAQLAPGFAAVGEFPIQLQGKVGSAVSRVPLDVVERASVEAGDRITTIALGPGAVLLVAERVVTETPDGVAGATADARAVLE